MSDLDVDVAVIGGGPAGLAAALATARAGHRVLIVDEGSRAGGRLLGQLYQEPSGGWWIGAQVAASMGADAEAAGVTVLSGRQVWALHQEATRPGTVWRLELDAGDTVRASHVVLATGAAERALPLPGWTLPGVMAVGAAQTLTNLYRVLPGERIAVVGADPLALTLTHELTLAGATVVGIFLPPADALAPCLSRRVNALEHLAGMAALAPNAFLRLGARLCTVPWLRRIIAACYPRLGMPMMGTRLRLREAVVGIEGTEQVSSVLVRALDGAGNPRGATRRMAVDCVVLSGGLYPLVELGSGCATANIPGLGGEVPLHGPELQTTRAGLHVAGNITGIEGAKVAAAQGHLAGCAITAQLDPGRGNADVDEARRALDAARATAPIAFSPLLTAGRARAALLWDEHQHAGAKGKSGPGEVTGQTGQRKGTA